jgi:GT2 family glycosyltransferase
MYIAVSAIQINYNPGAYNIQGTVVSSGGTNTGFEVFVDDNATAEDLNSAIAEAARGKCRENSENIDTDQAVTIFGGAVQVS